MGFAADLIAKVNPLRLSGVVITGLALALTVQTIRLNGLTVAPKAGAFHFTLLDLQGWRPRALAAEADLAKVKDAQRDAQVAQIATNHQPAITTASIARQADAQTPDYLRRAAAFAAAHALPAGGLCRASADKGSTGHADLSGTDHPAQGDDGKAGSPDMVSVARTDWEKLNREAALRVQLYQVGQEWVADGVAKASADDPPADGAH